MFPLLLKALNENPSTPKPSWLQDVKLIWKLGKRPVGIQTSSASFLHAALRATMSENWLHGRCHAGKDDCGTSVSQELPCVTMGAVAFAIID